MGETNLFTLRPLESISDTLDGAFRVYFHPDDLKTLHLSVGDHCRLKTQTGKEGIAIAWRSPTANTRRLIKVSHTLKDALEFTLGDKVFVSAYNGGLLHAKEIWIRQITSKSNVTDAQHIERRVWGALYELEGLWAGGHFDVSIRHPVQAKDRFAIERIEGTGDGVAIRAPYCFQPDTVLHLSGAPSPKATDQSVDQGAHASSEIVQFEGIGGLDRQLQRLRNQIRKMQNLVDKTSTFVPYLKNGRPRRILLHGAPGTGKSLVLARIKTATPFRGVFELPAISGNSTIKGGQLVVQMFQDATTHQPSAIIIDNLDQIAGKSAESPYPVALRAEIDKLGSSQVMIIAAARSPNDLNSALRPYFDCEIELPVPDSHARKEILEALRLRPSKTDDDLPQQVASLTHGFVGRDLEQLCREADDTAFERQASVMSTVVQTDGNIPSESLSPTDHGQSSVKSTTIADFQAAAKLIRPTAMREVFLQTPHVSWSDIGGSQAVKDALWLVVDLPFKYPDVMARSPYVPPKGILLYGPPGCSKTLTARAIASSSGLNFISVKGAELTSMYVGETERALREVFRKAQTAAPSVIFFDEIDAIAAARESSHGTPGLNIVTTLLTEMDGVQALRDVLVLAATNRPDVLDPALLRPGRFDTVLYVPPPPLNARKQILSINTRHEAFGSLDLDDLAQRTDGFSGAEIVEVCNLATGRWTRRQMKAASGSGDVMKMAINDNTSSAVDDSTALAIHSIASTTVGDIDKVSMEDFNAVLGSVRKVITPEMIKRYEDWAVQRTDIAQL